MRTYYIFKIKSGFKLINNPYRIYKVLDNIHTNNKDNLINILNRFDKDYVSNKINNLYKSDLFYSNRNNIHNYNDYFNNEETSLEVNTYYLKITSNKNLPTFLYDIANYNDMFVIDFNTPDYFWCSEISSKLLV